MVLDDLPESLEDLLGTGAHLPIFFFFFRPPAEPESEDPQGTNYRSTDLSISSQASPESAHGPDDFLVLPPQLLLPDRKNGLASVEALDHQLNRLFSHLFQGHDFFLQGFIGLIC
jgi:hypothetical protein